MPSAVRFLRQYWFWVLAPLVALGALLLALWILGGQGDDYDFAYPLS